MRDSRSRHLFFSLTLLVFMGLSVDSPTPARAESPDASEKSEKSSPAPPIRAESAPSKPAPADAVEKLRDEINGILQNRVSSKAKVGIAAVDMTTGQVLYERNADEGFNPASNMKLLTSAAALDAWGPAYTFETKLYGRAAKNGVIPGPLFVKGEGDAFLLFEDFISWAGQLKLKGIERIEGGIVIDDSIFDGSYLPPGFGQKDEDASYRSPIGAVTVNFNAVTVIATPASQAGSRPETRMYPPNEYVTIDNRAKTVSGYGRRLTFKSEPDGDGGTKIIVEGKIGKGASEMRSRLRIDHPPGFAGSVLEKVLGMVGISVDGPIRTGKVNGDLKAIVSHRSQPLSYIVLAMNKWSNNFMAEQLLRTLGAKNGEASTWEASRKQLHAFLEKAGLQTDAIKLKNGSGLYDGNEVPPREFVRLLTYMRDHSAGPEFVSSLAVAGRDGTLKDRMEGSQTAGNVRGKTGTLNKVSALSGYVTTRSGRPVAFSVILNDTPRRAWRYRPAQDAIVEALAEFDE